MFLMATRLFLFTHDKELKMQRKLTDSHYTIVISWIQNFKSIQDFAMFSWWAMIAAKLHLQCIYIIFIIVSLFHAGKSDAFKYCTLY